MSKSIEQDLSALGVREGGVLVVHTSFRAVGPVASGPLGLIGALRAALGPEGTLVMPTMTDGATVFDPRSTPTHGMGITAETFWRQPGVVRSSHPGGSFAAEGPLAGRICAPQPLSPPHGPDSPVGRVHELAGHLQLRIQKEKRSQSPMTIPTTTVMTSGQRFQDARSTSRIAVRSVNLIPLRAAGAAATAAPLNGRAM